MSLNPVIIGFPGAWHPASTFSPFISSLQNLGFEAEAHAMLAVGHANISVEDDAAYIRSLLLPHIEAGKDVVVVTHSYSGVPAIGAVSGLSKRERESRGEKGGILGAAYISSATIKPGQTGQDIFGGSFPPWLNVVVSQQPNSKDLI